MKRSLRFLFFLLVAASACAAGYAVGMSCIEYQTGTSETVQTILSPIDEFRQERKILRQTQITQLNEMLLSNACEPTQKSLAQSRLLDILEWSEQELTVEGILSMRGFENPVVTVHDDAVNVLLHSETLTSQHAAIILDIVVTETGIPKGNVKIIPLK